MATMFPFAGYEDARGAIDWLCRAFGFERRVVHEDEDGTVAHAELGYGESVFMVGNAAPNEFGLGTPRQAGVVTGGIYVVVEDIDAHYEAARAAGAEIVRGLADTDYGSREYMACDPEGHLWSFGTYRPGS